MTAGRRAASLPCRYPRVRLRRLLAKKGEGVVVAPGVAAASVGIATRLIAIRLSLLRLLVGVGPQLALGAPLVKLVDTLARSLNAFASRFCCRHRRPEMSVIANAHLCRSTRLENSRAHWPRRSVLARISQQNKCIGAANQRKILLRQSLTRTAGIPRCRQSVARRCLNLHPSKTGRWWLISAAER